MRIIVWLVADTWRATVQAAGALAPGDADVTLLYVTGEAEALARAAPRGLLGRHHFEHEPSVDQLSDDAARQLLADATTALGRSAASLILHGRPEEQVLGAVSMSDILVLARDGDQSRPGPHSLGRATRFVLDHAPCAILLVWPSGQPGERTGVAT